MKTGSRTGFMNLHLCLSIARKVLLHLSDKNENAFLLRIMWHILRASSLSSGMPSPKPHSSLHSMIVSWCVMIWVGETEQSSGILRAHPAPDHVQKPDLFLTQNFVPLSLLGHLAFKLLPHLISKLVAEVFVHLGGVILCPSNKSGLVSIGIKELC